MSPIGVADCITWRYALSGLARLPCLHCLFTRQPAHGTISSECDMSQLYHPSTATALNIVPDDQDVLQLSNEHAAKLSAAEPRQEEGGGERFVYAPGERFAHVPPQDQVLIVPARQRDRRVYQRYSYANHIHHRRSPEA